MSTVAYREKHREKARLYAAEYRKKNPEKIKAQNAAWYKNNPEKVRAYTKKRNKENCIKHRADAKAWKEKNPEKVRAIARRCYLKNRKKMLIKGAAWLKSNPKRNAAYRAKRRALKKSQCCPCCSTTQIYDEFYLYAGKELEVDHIKPLVLGGLHCRRNLQLLTSEEHRKKTAQDLRLISQARRAKLTPEGQNAV